MKKKYIFAVIAAVLITFILCACPPSADELVPRTRYVKIEPGKLDYMDWIILLIDISQQNDFIDLDLSDCTHTDENDNFDGGLVKFTISEGVEGDPNYAEQEYIAFDPNPRFTWGKDKIVSITLPKEATMIIGTEIPEDDEPLENWAFKHFTNLRSVTGENVNIIGEYAFYNCKSLQKVDFPHVSHTVLTSELMDPNNDMINGFRVDIGHNAFENCTALNDVSIPNATVIGRSAFKGCTNLKILNFSHIWMIEQNAFEGCTGLTDIEFANATKIGEEAFKNCNRLVTASFPAVRWSFPGDPDPLISGEPNYASIIFYDRAFYGCKALKRLEVRSAWNVYFSDGALANIGKTLELHLFDSTDSQEAYGHPQLAKCFGVDDSEDDNYPQTLEAITLKVPTASPHIDENIHGNIAFFIKNYDPEIEVEILRNL